MLASNATCGIRDVATDRALDAFYAHYEARGEAWRSARDG